MFRIFFLVVLFFSNIFALDEGRCGTMHFANIQKNKAKRFLAKESSCQQNFGTVLERKTKNNFIIYYTKEGQHAIKDPLFIDSLAHHLDGAYKLHKDSLGMKGISGVSRTLHYDKIVPIGFYPVEVLDLGLLRGYEGEFDMTYGITFELVNEPNKTQIVIENDFLRGADCNGKASTIPLYSTINGNYFINWHLALKATVYHELYHAFQFMYSYNDSFWHEASATGVEAIGAPEVKDYIGYLGSAFANTGNSMGNSDGYSNATLYLFLFKKLGSKFDSKIWNYFSKNPNEKFSLQLAKLAESNENAEAIFHEYARNVFFSGKRTSVPQAVIWWSGLNPEPEPEPEQSKWPLWNIKNSTPSALPGSSIYFARSSKKPILDSVSVSNLEYGDSSVWVLSRLIGPEKEDSLLALQPKKFIAYPNPWNPNKNPVLKFSLSKPFSDVEIRSANGALLGRAKGVGDTAMWQPKYNIAPGILYYRMLPYGKNKVLIVKY